MSQLHALYLQAGIKTLCQDVLAKLKLHSPPQSLLENTLELFVIAHKEFKPFVFTLC
jgi:hypothetical protein